MHRVLLLCGVVALAGCPSDGNALLVETITYPPNGGGGVSTIAATGYDADGGAWILTHQSAMWRLPADSTTWTALGDVSSIGTSQPLSMRWDSTNRRMLVLSGYGLYSVAAGTNVTTVWSRNSIENPEYLFGTTGAITWMLAHDDTNTRYLTKVSASGELTTAHSGGIPMNIGTEPQGLALPDGRLLIVHDPIDGASAWIASADGSLTPVWPCESSCTKPPLFQVGPDGQLLAESSTGLAAFDTATGMVGAQRVIYSWPVIGMTEPMYAGTTGSPLALDDDRVFALFRKQPSDGSPATQSLLGTKVDGMRWSELATGLPPGLVLEHESAGVLHGRDIGGDGNLVRISL